MADVATPAPEPTSEPTVEPVAPAQPATEQPAPAAAEAEPSTAAAEAPAEKKEPLDPENAAKRKAERLEKRKEQRKAARQAAKEARAAGEPAKPRPAKAAKADAQPAAQTAPKISVVKLPADMTTSDLKALFEPYGIVLRAEVSKRKGRPTLGTVIFNTHNDVRRAVAALNGKHKCAGVDEPLSIQYAKDSQSLGELVKKTTDGVADLIRQYEYKPGVLRSKDAKDFINRMVLARKSPPATELLTAALLVHTKSAPVDELVGCGVVDSANAVQQLLKDEKPAAGKAAPKSPARERREDTKAGVKLEKTFDAVVPHLDKLEKDRWNLMAKANLRLNEHHRFRFVDILATPSLELWRWMVEDCEITPAEAGTCFCILQNYYGFTK